MKKARRFKENNGVVRKKCVEIEQIAAGAEVGENSELAGKGSLQAQKLASCLLKNLCFTAPEIQPESVGRSSIEII